MTTNELKEKIIEKLKDIYDPEIPVNIYDLGLIYSIDCSDKDTVTVCTITMTLTSATCPVGESIVNQVRDIAGKIDEIPELIIEANLVFDPPWDYDKMSDEAKLHLGMM
jgi:metal-sulfur cluster biosynthetic enzyme